MSVGGSVFERLLPGVRRAERDRFLFFFALSALLSLGQTLGLTGSEALFLAALGADALPLAFLLAALVTIVGSLAYASVVGRVRNDRLFAVLLAGAGASLAVAWLVAPLGLWSVYMLLFTAFYLFQTVLLNLHFWTFVADFFDTMSSKRVFPLFAVGGGVGGALGGATAMAISAWGSAEDLIAGWSVVLLLAAGLVMAGRGRFLAWAPIGVPELDESSMSGLQGAWRFARRSPLARWLVASVVGMVFSLFLIQYVYMGIFERSFSSAQTLAAFFGAYLAITNVIELFVGRVVTPWLIDRLGVAQANLLHPLLTLVTFAVLALDPRLHAAVFARLTRELLENSLAGPIRSLSYNALAQRFRGRMRALLEGAVPYAGMLIAGATLLAIGDGVALPHLCVVGAASALLYIGANLQVRREYLRSLVADLGAGRLELEDVRAQLGARELEGIAAQWHELLAEEGGRPSMIVLQLAPLLARTGLVAPLRKTASDGAARARVACLDALAEYRDPEIPRLAAEALVADDDEVRLAGARAATGLFSLPDDLYTILRNRLSDPDPRTRAECARRLDREGLQTLEQMARDSDPRITVAALERLPVALLDVASERLGDSDSRVRAAAITCVTRIGPRDAIATADLVSELEHPDPVVRRAAAAALGQRTEAVGALAHALDDVSRAVRGEAQAALSGLGDAGVEAARPLFHGSRTWTVDAALSAVANAEAGGIRDHLLAAYRERVEEAWRSSLAIDVLAEASDLVTRFLAAALQDASLRSRFLAFRVLELLEDPVVVRSVTRALERTDSGLRANALEVLTHLGERETSQLFAILLEDGKLAEKIPALGSRVAPPRGTDDVLSDARASGDRWLLLAAAGLSRDGADPDLTEEIQTMERLLALRHVPLFQGLSLEQLEAIQQFMRDVQYIEGEVVMREGDPGHELFVLLEGEVQVIKGHGTPDETVLNTMRPVTYMGEIAILDASPRSATVVVTQDARMLSLDGDRFKELIRQAPEIAFEIFPILTARIRAAESGR